MTDNEADLAILSLANGKGKFAVATTTLHAPLQLALERGQEMEWFRLIDVSPLAEAPTMLFRIFKLTDAGLARLAAIAPRKS